MSSSWHNLVADIIAATGAQGPDVLDESAPVLAEAALADDRETGFYLVGLIGGKDVGKSALVNALVGSAITDPTSFGPGTQGVVAYAHETQVEALRQLLDDLVPGQYRIVTHSIPRLSRQVLLDLPDIDSHWEDHVRITRRMLRHLLYPVWVQSVEKYADRRPQELLAAVASGNDPRNFVFCLNKLDQVAGDAANGALRELRDDYAERIAHVLGLGETPRVWGVSAIHPDRHDLPALRNALAQQKTHQVVRNARQLAARQKGLSLLTWIENQELPQRLAQLGRLAQAAEEEINDRLAQPLLDRVAPRILDDPALRLGEGDQLLTRRVARWPIVNIMHVVLEPIAALVRRRLGLSSPLGPVGAEDLVHRHLQSLVAADAREQGPDASVVGRPLAQVVQSTFAGLRQTHPQLAQLYERRRLWETASAQSAEAELRQKLAATVERQRQVLQQRIAPRRGILRAATRWLFTIGAVLWFPFIQPVVEAAVGGRNPALLLVSVIGVSYLLKNVAFLLAWFAGLWVALKWDTQRRVDRALDRWKRPTSLDPTLSLAGQTLDWLDGLVEPIRSARQRMEELVARSEELRRTLA
jgi:hypothetical protein